MLYWICRPSNQTPSGYPWLAKWLLADLFHRVFRRCPYLKNLVFPRNVAQPGSALVPKGSLSRRDSFGAGLGVQDRMSVSVYILQSDSTRAFYIGEAEDLQKRLKKHNNGESRSTKSGRPWRLVYSEEFPSRSEAVRRERSLKSPKGWKELREIKNRITSERSAAR